LQKDGPSSLIRVDKDRLERLEGEPWYKEVQELRKAANDYKVGGGQCFGSGSVSGSGSILEPYSIGPLDPDPDP
jgi:hypothetical protein